MANIIDLKNNNHYFEKQNSITKTEGRNFYDLYKCCNCGIKGKRYGFNEELTIDGRISKKKIQNCSGAKKVNKIIITKCTAVGTAFKNLTPDSVHEVIDAPTGQNNSRGVWVMGVGEPVKVLFCEYKEIL